jgi:hypothetical protein
VSQRWTRPLVPDGAFGAPMPFAGRETGRGSPAGGRRACAVQVQPCPAPGGQKPRANLHPRGPDPGSKSRVVSGELQQLAVLNGEIRAERAC